MIIQTNFNILVTSLKILHNYFDGKNKIIFRSVSSQIFRFFSKIISCRKKYFNTKINIHNDFNLNLSFYPINLST